MATTLSSNSRISKTHLPIGGCMDILLPPFSPCKDSTERHRIAIQADQKHRQMITPINTYAPSIIRSLGFSLYAANGMNSVGSAVSLVIVLSLAWHSDRTRERGLHIAFGYLIPVVGLFWVAYVPNNKWLIYSKQEPKIPDFINTC